MESLLDRFSHRFVRNDAGRVSIIWDDGPREEDIVRASHRLTDANRQIVQARAAAISSVWPDTSELAKQQFSVRTRWERLGGSIGFGVLGLILGIPVSWLILLAVSWCWYFCLDRLREISCSLRGKHDGEMV